jgi:hypothetical protein
MLSSRPLLHFSCVSFHRKSNTDEKSTYIYICHAYALEITHSRHFSQQILSWRTYNSVDTHGSDSLPGQLRLSTMKLRSIPADESVPDLDVDSSEGHPPKRVRRNSYASSRQQPTCKTATRTDNPTTIAFSGSNNEASAYAKTMGSSQVPSSAVTSTRDGVSRASSSRNSRNVRDTALDPPSVIQGVPSGIPGSKKELGGWILRRLYGRSERDCVLEVFEVRYDSFLSTLMGLSKNAVYNRVRALEEGFKCDRDSIMLVFVLNKRTTWLATPASKGCTQFHPDDWVGPFWHYHVQLSPWVVNTALKVKAMEHAKGKVNWEVRKLPPDDEPLFSRRGADFEPAANDLLSLERSTAVQSSGSTAPQTESKSVRSTSMSSTHDSQNSHAAATTDHSFLPTGSTGEDEVERIVRIWQKLSKKNKHVPFRVQGFEGCVVGYKRLATLLERKEQPLRVLFQEATQRNFSLGESTVTVRRLTPLEFARAMRQFFWKKDGEVVCWIVILALLDITDSDPWYVCWNWKEKEVDWQEIKGDKHLAEKINATVEQVQALHFQGFPKMAKWGDYKIHLRAMD